MNNETITQRINQAATSGKLDLCEQQLTTFPPTVIELTNLEELYLDSNQLAELPAEIAQLVNLRVLSLTDNRLKALPPPIAELKNLEWLYLANNQFTSVPSEITQLPHLKVISFDNNQIKELPEAITNLPNLKVLSHYNNPLTFPPPEIVTQGTQEILTYLRLKKEPQWAAKLLLVGEGGVGKTSLLHKLHGETFNEQEDSTHGIAIDTWTLKHPTKADVTMQLRTWDFGGQTIYHATHQFFLTNRALFILVWNARLGYEQCKLSYWLNIIQAKAPQSPVLLVATHIDEYDAALPFVDLKHKYPQIIGDKHCKVSNKTGAGIDETRQAIASAATKLPLMGEKWPIHWRKAANAMSAKPDKSMIPNQLDKLMTDHGVARNHCIILTRWLHELGELLYFHDNEDLKNVVILKPQWVTEHISLVLTSQQVIDKQGILTDAHRDTLWSDLDHEMRAHFSNLMEQFDLSYCALEDRHTRFVVECLPSDPPDYQTTWDKMSGAKEIRMTYELNTLPPGIPTWFIARAHRFTTNTHWRYGALFADNVARHHLGLIRVFPEERRLELVVRGSSPHYFFDVLRDGLEFTLQRFPGLQIKRKIPCPGHHGEACLGEFNYHQLEKAMQKNVVEIQCQEALENISVPQLLFGLDWRTQDAVLQKIEEVKKEMTKEMTGAEENISNLFNWIQAHFRKQHAELQCPYAFTLSQQPVKWWQPFAARDVMLQLYCQQPGHLHKIQEGGCYHIYELDKWSHFIAPHLSKLIMLFNAFITLGVSTVEQKNQLKNDLDFMSELKQQFPNIDDHLDDATKRGLCVLLKELDPSHNWGGLKPVHVKPQDDVLWLCQEHAKEYK
jgi:small GTP-binding protein